MFLLFFFLTGEVMPSVSLLIFFFAFLALLTNFFCMLSMPRAMKRAPAPSAKATGEIGLSTDPSGVEGERVPALEVGEYCPFVRP